MCKCNFLEENGIFQEMAGFQKKLMLNKKKINLTKLAAKLKKDKEYKCQVRLQKVDEMKSHEPKIAADSVISPDPVLGPFHGF